ncbi:hypothetical protein GQX74_014277 [Glossina fuscipes]|nr:hypothetical protein GQX74_014277 [Glossina fuscipes]
MARSIHSDWETLHVFSSSNNSFISIVRSISVLPSSKISSVIKRLVISILTGAGLSGRGGGGVSSAGECCVCDWGCGELLKDLILGLGDVGGVVVVTLICVSTTCMRAMTTLSSLSSLRGFRGDHEERFLTVLGFGNSSALTMVTGGAHTTTSGCCLIASLISGMNHFINIKESLLVELTLYSMVSLVLGEVVATGMGDDDTAVGNGAKATDPNDNSSNSASI